MIRIQLRYAKPHMHLSGPLLGPDGQLVAGQGTTLTPQVVSALMRHGYERVEVDEAEGVADWEMDKDLARALADLEARFASETVEGPLAQIKEALARHLRARADRPGGPS